MKTQTKKQNANKKKKTEVQSKTEVNRKNAKGLSSSPRCFSEATMFCSSCGAKSCLANAKYCSNCGAQYPSNKPTNCNKTIGFDDFKKRKEMERSTRFQPKKKLKVLSTKSKAKETKASINIGFLRVEASGNLKRCRGKTLPVKVRPTANAQCIFKLINQNFMVNSVESFAKI